MQERVWGEDGESSEGQSLGERPQLAKSGSRKRGDPGGKGVVPYLLPLSQCCRASAEPPRPQAG